MMNLARRKARFSVKVIRHVPMPYTLNAIE